MLFPIFNRSRKVICICQSLSHQLWVKLLLSPTHAFVCILFQGLGSAHFYSQTALDISVYYCITLRRDGRPLEDLLCVGRLWKRLSSQTSTVGTVISFGNVPLQLQNVRWYAIGEGIRFYKYRSYTFFLPCFKNISQHVNALKIRQLKKIVTDMTKDWLWVSLHSWLYSCA